MTSVRPLPTAVADAASLLSRMDSETADELAAMIASCEPGESVRLHQDACKATPYNVNGCTCTPLELRRGAES